jgi:hypothetical protein
MSGSKTKRKRKLNHNEEEQHDPKTCFRCRLFGVVAELRPLGMTSEDDAHEFLDVLAEATGMMLAQLDADDFKIYMMHLMSWREASCKALAEEGGMTKH